MRKLLLACAFGLAAPALAQQAPAACGQEDPLAPGMSRATVLHAAPLLGTEQRTYRLHAVELGPETETARQVNLGDGIVLVTEGSVTLEVPEDEPRSFRAGQAFHLPPMLPHLLRNSSATEPARLLVGSIAAPGMPPAVPVSHTY